MSISHERISRCFTRPSSQEFVSGQVGTTMDVGAILEIGSTLREAREHRHLSQTEVEAATMIPTRYLEALEHEQYERLPEGLYRRSFLREYAEYLGLNGDLYVVEYDLEHQPPPPPDPPPPPPKAVAVPVRAVAIAVCIALVAGGLWWLGGRGDDSPSPARATLPPRHAVAPRTAAPAKKTAPAPPAAPPALTRVAAKGDCWLSVRVGSADGPLAYQGTLRRGSHVAFGLRRRLLVRMGAPENLTATIGGRSVTASLPGHTANVVVTAQGLAAS
jgi:transcriptional regulator with XRE-family HTH domain